jgi:hypothetical protein
MHSMIVPLLTFPVMRTNGPLPILRPRNEAQTARMLAKPLLR